MNIILIMLFLDQVRASSLIANYLSKDNEIALVDIASKKKSKERTRYVPPFVNRFTKTILLQFR